MPKPDTIARISWEKVISLPKVSLDLKVKVELLSTWLLVPLFVSIGKKGGDYPSSVWWWGWFEHRRLQLRSLPHV
jgi:hypothetical protein